MYLMQGSVDIPNTMPACESLCRSSKLKCSKRQCRRSVLSMINDSKMLQLLVPSKFRAWSLYRPCFPSRMALPKSCLVPVSRIIQALSVNSRLYPWSIMQSIESKFLRMSGTYKTMDLNAFYFSYGESNNDTIFSSYLVNLTTDCYHQ